MLSEDLTHIYVLRRYMKILHIYMCIRRYMKILHRYIHFSGTNTLKICRIQAFLRSDQCKSRTSNGNDKEANQAPGLGNVTDMLVLKMVRLSAFFWADLHNLCKILCTKKPSLIEFSTFVLKIVSQLYSIWVKKIHTLFMGQNLGWRFCFVHKNDIF